MDELKHVYYTGNNGWNNCGGYGYGYGGCGGFGGGLLALGLGALALGGLGLAGIMKRNDETERYLTAKSQGAMESAIACNGSAIARVENTLSQMQQNSIFNATIASASQGVINAINVNQQKTDTGLAVNANQSGLILDFLKSVSTPNSIYSATRPVDATA